MPAFFSPDQLRACQRDDVAAGTFAFPLEEGGARLFVAGRSTDNEGWVVPIDGEPPFTGSHAGQPHLAYRRWQVLAEDTTGETTILFERDR